MKVFDEDAEDLYIDGPHHKCMKTATPRSVGHTASSRARAALELAEQARAEWIEELIVAAIIRGIELGAHAYTATNALRLDDAARGLAVADAALTAARDAMPKRKGK